MTVHENEVRQVLIGSGTPANPDLFALRKFVNSVYFGQLPKDYQVTDEYKNVENLVHELVELWHRLERTELIEERK